MYPLTCIHQTRFMTAGKGIVHGEMFPLLHMDKPNTLRLFQIWLNLPKARKMVEPTQLMLWSENIPVVEDKEGGVKVRVWAGNVGGVQALPPTPVR
jgi:quercetin 2,3-dioxygenase